MEEPGKDGVTRRLRDNARTQDPAGRWEPIPMHAKGFVASVVLVHVVIPSDDEDQAFIDVDLLWVLPVGYHSVVVLRPNVKSDGNPTSGSQC